MKIKVQKDELQKKLSDIQNVVEKKNTMPILNHFLLSVRDDGSFIAATDLETAVKEPIEAEVLQEGDVCIPARKLFEIVKEMEGDLSIETTDSQWVKIRSGKSNFRLACLSSEDFPVWPSFEDDLETLQIPASTLREMIDKTLYSAGESDTRYVLNSLMFHIKPDGGLSVVGTDGHRLALLQKQMEVSTKGEKKLIVSRKAISELRRFLSEEGIVKLTLSGNHILFNTETAQFLTRLVEGTYPNYEQVIPTSNEKVMVADRNTLAKALRRISIMSKERSNAIKMDITESSAIISASNPDLGEASEEISISYNGSPMTIFFNARYILDALNAMSSDNIVFKLNEPLSPAMIMEQEKQDYICIIMPMRG